MTKVHLPPDTPQRILFRPLHLGENMELMPKMGIYVTQVDAGYPNILWFQKSGGAEHLTSDL